MNYVSTYVDPVPKVSLPEGESGGWRVKQFTVEPEAALMSLMRLGDRAVNPGTYTGLYMPEGRGIMMSDTDAERRDHREPVRRAAGVCLVNGLGLGMAATAMALKPEVERVIVIDNSPDVIALVGPHMGVKIEVVLADAFDWQPPKGLRFGAVWHDIWPTISLDDQPERTRLMRKYGRRADWQGCWAQDVLRREARRSARGWW